MKYGFCFLIMISLVGCQAHTAQRKQVDKPRVAVGAPAPNTTQIAGMSLYDIGRAMSGGSVEIYDPAVPVQMAAYAPPPPTAMPVAIVEPIMTEDVAPPVGVRAQTPVRAIQPPPVPEPPVEIVAVDPEPAPVFYVDEPDVSKNVPEPEDVAETMPETMPVPPPLEDAPAQTDVFLTPPDEDNMAQAEVPAPDAPRPPPQMTYD